MMKRLVPILALFCLVLTTWSGVAAHVPAAGDTLYLRNREKKVVEIREVYPDVVKYKTGTAETLVSTPVTDVAGIIYSNGTSDLFHTFDAKVKPEVRWLEYPTFSSEAEVRIRACVLNEAENIRLEMNGRVASMATRSFKVIAPREQNCLGGTMVTPQVTLTEGKNVIRLLAGNAAGPAASEPLTIQYEKAKKRIALVIGNSGYQTGARLQNPENDAKSISQKLSDLGFDVIERIDARQADLRASVAQFGSAIQGQNLEVALFYYAGHGVQVGGKNYLIPVDISPQSEMELKMLAVSADDVLDQMATAEDNSQRTNIMILDACRDNPLSRSWVRSTGSKGLASMSAPPGSLITFSTKPGYTALDGDGKNSPYTSELLKALDVPGLRLEDIFRTVRIRVMELTNRQQVPMENSLLTREVILNRIP